MIEFDFDINEIFVQRCPFMRFKGKSGSKIKMPAQPSLGAIGSEAEENLYEAIERGITGGGFFPFADKSYTELKKSYAQAYETAQGEMGSQLERLVPKADVGVRGYAKDVLSKGYYGSLDELERQKRAEEYGGQEMALTYGTQLLAEAKKMGVNILDIYNQQQLANWQNQQQYGTFTSNLASGLGQMGGFLAVSNYANRMSGGGYNPMYGGYNVQQFGGYGNTPLGMSSGYSWS
jgi:hypothetical protein